jgi:hypothetical protein
MLRIYCPVQLINGQPINPFKWPLISTLASTYQLPNCFAISCMLNKSTDGCLLSWEHDTISMLFGSQPHFAMPNLRWEGRCLVLATLLLFIWPISHRVHFLPAFATLLWLSQFFQDKVWQSVDGNQTAPKFDILRGNVDLKRTKRRFPDNRPYNHN